MVLLWPSSSEHMIIHCIHTLYRYIAYCWSGGWGGGGVISGNNSFGLMKIYIYMYICVCVCVRARARVCVQRGDAQKAQAAWPGPLWPHLTLCESEPNTLNRQAMDSMVLELSQPWKSQSALHRAKLRMAERARWQVATPAVIELPDIGDECVFLWCARSKRRLRQVCKTLPLPLRKVVELGMV